MNVLVVDDSVYMRAVIRTVLVKAGYKVIGEARTGEEAIDQAIEKCPDLITLDNVLPDMMGIDVLNIIRDDQLPSKVVMVSAVGQAEMIKEAKARGAAGYVVKPFEADKLLSTIRYVMKDSSVEV